MTSALRWGVSGQHYAPAVLPPGKTQYPLYRRLVRTQGRSGRVRKISPPPGFDHGGGTCSCSRVQHMISAYAYLFIAFLLSFLFCASCLRISLPSFILLWRLSSIFAPLLFLYSSNFLPPLSTLYIGPSLSYLPSTLHWRSGHMPASRCCVMLLNNSCEYSCRTQQAVTSCAVAEVEDEGGK